MTTMDTFAMPPVSVGEILIMQAEFAEVSLDESKPAGMRQRAVKLAQLLEELIEYRRTYPPSAEETAPVEEAKSNG